VRAEAGGFRLRTLSEPGDREWLVLLPGAGATSAVWFNQARVFGRHFNLAFIDLPGHGRSVEPAKPQASYSFDRLADDLEATIAEAGIARCHVMALSLGTVLARLWQARHPRRARSMVLAGSIVDLPLLARVLIGAGLRLRLIAPYMLLYRLYAWIIMPGRGHAATRRLFYRDAQMLGPDEFNRWFSLAEHTNALLAQLRMAMPTVPVLHVMGGNDRMFLPSAMALARTQSARVVVIQNCGHVCTVEAPQAFNKAALDFLVEQTRARAH
jgi:pimeloyl-ACP methyl ester carboxylesterase